MSGNALLLFLLKFEKKQIWTGNAKFFSFLIKTKANLAKGVRSEKETNLVWGNLVWKCLVSNTFVFPNETNLAWWGLRWELKFILRFF